MPKVQTGNASGWPTAVAESIGGGTKLSLGRPGQPENVLFLPCKGVCGETKEFRFSGGRLPPGIIIKKLKEVGWRIGKKLVCPDCNGHAPKVVAMEEDMAGKMTLAGGTALGNTIGIGANAVSAEARKVKRQIVEWLDMSYDLEKQHYKDGFSDETVAKETRAAVDHVAKIREEMYGPAQPPEPKEIRRLREDITMVQETLENLKTHLSGAEGTLIRLKDRLEHLVKTNSWRT